MRNLFVETLNYSNKDKVYIYIKDNLDGDEDIRGDKCRLLGVLQGTKSSFYIPNDICTIYSIANNDFENANQIAIKEGKEDAYIKGKIDITEYKSEYVFSEEKIYLLPKKEKGKTGAIVGVILAIVLIAGVIYAGFATGIIHEDATYVGDFGIRIILPSTFEWIDDENNNLHLESPKYPITIIGYCSYKDYLEELYGPFSSEYQALKVIRGVDESDIKWCKDHPYYISTDVNDGVEYTYYTFCLINDIDVWSVRFICPSDKLNFINKQRLEEWGGNIYLGSYKDKIRDALFTTDEGFSIVLNDRFIEVEDPDDVFYAENISDHLIINVGYFTKAQVQGVFGKVNSAYEVVEKMYDVNKDEILETNDSVPYVIEIVGEDDETYNVYTFWYLVGDKVWYIDFYSASAVTERFVNDIFNWVSTAKFE